jgi:uncharacterized protein (DUF305 family)
MATRLVLLATASAVVLFLAACSGGSDEPEASSTAPATTETGPAIVQPGAPGETSETLTPEEADDLETPPYTDADVEFMRAMISHHEQALEMTGYVPDRGAGRAIRLLAERLRLSQEAETEQMVAWLEKRDEEPTGAHSGSMPGMLTPAELEAMRNATGREFNRLFLRGMMKHHRGALTMVSELYEQPGGGFEPEIDNFARHVVADQEIEIDRIETLLAQFQDR